MGQSNSFWVADRIVRNRGKRIIDLVLGTSALVVSSPLLVLIMVLIAFTSGRPIIFRQVRPGLGGKPFVLYKFRTMRESRGADEKLQADEERLTHVGSFLRRTSLDELPELWNVIRGEMSLVGPRPLLLEYLELYSPEQARRQVVKPGITGLAQVSGRNQLGWEQRFERDLWYIDNWSLQLDLRILLRTVGKVLKMEAISGEGRATMEPFRGTTQ